MAFSKLKSICHFTALISITNTSRPQPTTAADEAKAKAAAAADEETRKKVTGEAEAKAKEDEVAKKKLLSICNFCLAAPLACSWRTAVMIVVQSC